jgi:putative ATPase
MAFFDAIKEVEKEDAEVPNNLRDASRDAEGFGHGEGYIYPHAYRDHWAAQQYLPSALVGRTFYTPSAVGYEGRIREEVMRKREIQAAVILGDASFGTGSKADSELLSWSSAAKGREGWFKRMESGRSALLLQDRDLILEQNKISRHDRILIAAANDGLLLWECLRRCPEGLTAALTDTASARDALIRFAEASALDESEKPLIAVFADNALPSPEEAEAAFDCPVFDHILVRELDLRRKSGRKSTGKNPAELFSAFAASAKRLLAPDGKVVILQSPPRMGERLSRILKEGSGEWGKGSREQRAENREQGAEANGMAANASCVLADLADKLAAAEEAFFAVPAYWTWDKETLELAFREQGFCIETKVIEREEERLLTARDLDNWFDEKGSWGSFIFQHIGDESFRAVRSFFEERITRGPILWKWRSLLVKAGSGE